MRVGDVSQPSRLRISACWAPSSVQRDASLIQRLSTNPRSSSVRRASEALRANCSVGLGGGGGGGGGRLRRRPGGRSRACGRDLRGRARGWLLGDPGLAVELLNDLRHLVRQRGFQRDGLALAWDGLARGWRGGGRRGGGAAP